MGGACAVSDPVRSGRSTWPDRAVFGPRIPLRLRGPRYVDGTARVVLPFRLARIWRGTLAFGTGRLGVVYRLDIFAMPVTAGYCSTVTRKSDRNCGKEL